jgi:hypothetical protein
MEARESIIALCDQVPGATLESAIRI